MTTSKASQMTNEADHLGNTCTVSWCPLANSHFAWKGESILHHELLQPTTTGCKLKLSVAVPDKVLT